MGLMTKSAVQEAKKAHRQSKVDKKRKINTRNSRVSFLIVCEGERTEPNYFNALINNRSSDVREVKIEGEGRGTVSLIKQTISIRDKMDQEFDRVWAVFDKDSFLDFNDAIKLAKKNNILCAWSNESFELWYYLHFQHLESGVSRSQYIGMIEREIQKLTGNKDYKYKKKEPKTFSLLQEFGSEQMAIKRAERLRRFFSDKNYAAHKPCTTVDLLVAELNEPETLL